MWASKAQLGDTIELINIYNLSTFFKYVMWGAFGLKRLKYSTRLTRNFGWIDSVHACLLLRCVQKFK